MRSEPCRQFRPVGGQRCDVHQTHAFQGLGRTLHSSYRLLPTDALCLSRTLLRSQHQRPPSRSHGLGIGEGSHTRVLVPQRNTSQWSARNTQSDASRSAVEYSVARSLLSELVHSVQPSAAQLHRSTWSCPRRALQGAPGCTQHQPSYEVAATIARCRSRRPFFGSDASPNGFHSRASVPSAPAISLMSCRKDPSQKAPLEAPSLDISRRPTPEPRSVTRGAQHTPTRAITYRLGGRTNGQSMLAVRRTGSYACWSWAICQHRPTSAMSQGALRRARMWSTARE